MEPAMHIDRCTCHNCRFEDILALAREHGTLDDLDATMELANCGRNCSVCRVFIRQTLRTGRTWFDEYPEEERH